ncbi:MAG: DUF1667 domain-containing protein [Clostridiales bacterium]|nr:DUF1667 domain-containing protein [Clostridiales bacterium]
MTELICIRCPIGCRLMVTDFLTVSGNQCKHGMEYAIEEMTAPKRIVTSLIKLIGADEPLSVKTEVPIPKELIFNVLEEIKKLRLQAPVEIGTVLIENILGTGVNIIATKTVK